jgi:hypothetical protein
MYAVPLIVPSGGVIDELSWDITTSGAGNARIGIYEATSISNLYPKNLIADLGTFSVGSTGFQGKTGLTVTLESSKLYWIASLSDVNWGVMAAGANFTSCILGYAKTRYINAMSFCSVSQAYGALPDPFTSGATLLGSGATEHCPAIYFHLAS